MGKKYLDYDPEKGETIEIEEDKTNFDDELKDVLDGIINDTKVTEKDLINHQIKKIIEEEKNKKTLSYIDENPSNLLDNKGNTKKSYDEIIESVYSQKKEELEKKYISKEETIHEDFSFKTNNKEKELSGIEKFFIKRKLKKKKAKEEKQSKKEKASKETSKNVGNKNVGKEKKEEVEDKVQEDKPKKKSSISFKSIVQKFFIFTLFAFLVILILQFIMSEENVENEPSKLAVNNNYNTDERTPIKVNRVSKIDKDLVLSFVKYLDKCEIITNSMVIISNEESETFTKYLNSEISREEIIKYYQQSMSKKEQLDLLFEDSNVHSEYNELYEIVKRRLRESINITKGILYSFNSFQKADVIESNIKKYIQTDRELATRHKNILIDLFEKFNINYKEEDGELLYDTYSVLE